MGAVIAEWIGADKGIGYYMLLQKSSFRTDKIFVAIAIIVAISLAMFVCVALLENGWSVTSRRTGKIVKTCAVKKQPSSVRRKKGELPA